MRINIAHIIFYWKYDNTPANMTGTQLALSGDNDNLQFAQETVEEIDRMIDEACAAGL